jgi:hypothetical protein
MRQASAYEMRHPWLIHNGLLLASVLTYWIDREDVVWRFIKSRPDARVLEHLSFGVAAVLLALGIWLRSRAAFNSSRNDPGRSRGKQLGDVLHAVGIGMLLPLSGFLLLLFGEFIRTSRYEIAKLATANTQRKEARRDATKNRLRMPLDPGPTAGLQWKSVLVDQAAACSALLSMVVFSITLVDRQAEFLFAATLLVSVLSHLLAPSTIE